MSQQPNSTHPELSMLYEIETDKQEFPFQCFDIGDMLWNIDPNHYNASKALALPTKQKTVIPTSLFTATMDAKRAWEKYKSLTPGEQETVDKYNIDVRLMKVNAAGMKWDPSKNEWETTLKHPYTNWKSWWNFMDPKYNNNHLRRLGLINVGYKVGDEKRTSPFENQTKKKRKYAYETEPRRITHIGTAWFRTTISHSPLEEKRITLNKQEVRNRNIYSTVKFSKTNEEDADLNDLKEDKSNISGNSCIVGAKLCFYWIKHELGYCYLEQYCEPYEGKLAFTTGDIKYQHFSFGGIILESNNPSSRNYSLNQRLMNRTKLTNGKWDGKVIEQLEWNTEHKDFYDHAKQMKIIHPIQTNYCLNENSRTTSMGLIMNNQSQNPYLLSDKYKFVPN